MADYKINFEYKGIGKQATAIRQKVLQAQKTADRKAGISQPSQNRELVSNIKKLDSSIGKLIISNNRLMRSMSTGVFGGGGGGGRRFGIGGVSMGGSAGFGRMGAAIPVLGAALAGVGFVIQKINQIGNSFIELTSQQLQSVGMGGFRRGRGIYSSAQMGAGMRAFATGTGRFANQVNPATQQTALNVGTMYGMSAEQVLGQAGLFQRAGGNFGRTAQMVAGGGVQADLPVLMTGLAGILQDAIREGINTSNMADDIGREMTALTMRTPGQSAEAALQMIRSFRGVQQGVGRGQLGTMESMYTAQASRDILMRNLGNEDYLNRLQRTGMISQGQRDAIVSMGPNANFQNLQQAIGGAGAFSLLRATATETNPATLLMQVMRNVQQQYGTSPEAFQRFSAVAAQQGFSQNQAQLFTAWNAARTTQEAQAETQQRQNLDRAIAGSGANVITTGAQGVRGSAAGVGAQRRIQRENMVLTYGAEFARQSVRMERAMMRLAQDAAPAATTAIEGIGTALTTMINGIQSLMQRIERSRESSGEFSFRRFLGFNLF